MTTIAGGGEIVMTKAVVMIMAVVVGAIHGLVIVGVACLAIIVINVGGLRVNVVLHVGGFRVGAIFMIMIVGHVGETRVCAVTTIRVGYVVEIRVCVITMTKGVVVVVMILQEVTHLRFHAKV
jgi:hypothetical protein